VAVNAYQDLATLWSIHSLPLSFELSLFLLFLRVPFHSDCAISKREKEEKSADTEWQENPGTA
jgi:hypothetical protein